MFENLGMLSMGELWTLLLPILIAVWVVVLIGGIGWAFYRYCLAIIFARIARAWRDGQMNRDQERREAALMADLITRSLEEAVQQGKLLESRRDFWYLRFGNVLNIPDLLPRGRKTLKQRLLEKREKFRNRKKKTVNIPGPKPPQKLTKNSEIAAEEERKTFSIFG